LLLSLVADDWRLYRADLLRTGITSEMIAPRTDGEPLKLKWATSISQKRITSTPTVAWGRLYVGTEEGDFLCLSALTGQIIWSYKTGGYVRSSPAFDQGRVYVGSRDGYLYCLHGGTGRLLWKAFHGGVQNSSPVVAAGAVFCGIGSPPLR
jgi:outer membrane protein assembly factor BamB